MSKNQQQKKCKKKLTFKYFSDESNCEEIVTPNWDTFSFEEELKARKIKSREFLAEQKTKVQKVAKHDCNNQFSNLFNTLCNYFLNILLTI